MGLSAIQVLIASGDAVSVEAAGEHLKAGTNCGSCQLEIKRLIRLLRGNASSQAQRGKSGTANQTITAGDFLIALDRGAHSACMGCA